MFSNVQSPDSPVLIIGGAGYIGSLLCRQLLSSGMTVRVLDNLIYGSHSLSELEGHPRFTLIRGDCRSLPGMVKATRGVRAVVHLAALVGDGVCADHPEEAIQINHASVRLAASIGRAQGVERFLFASSCSVYGISDDLLDENSPVHPLSLYAKTKVDSERFLLDFAGKDFHPVILRFATVFGLSPRPRFDLVANLLPARAFAERSITVYNPGQWRPFLHVWDAAAALASAVRLPLSTVSGEVFNVGDSQMNWRLSDLAEKVRDFFPETRVQTSTGADFRNYRVNFAKIRQRFPFTCSTTLEQGISELAGAFTCGLIEDYNAPAYSNQQFLRRAHASCIAASAPDDRLMKACLEDDFHALVPPAHAMAEALSA